MSARRLGTDAEIVEFIREFAERHGYAPTIRDVAGHWGVAASSADTMLRRLAEEGLIARPPGIPRAMRVTDNGMKMLDAHNPTLHG